MSQLDEAIKDLEGASRIPPELRPTLGGIAAQLLRHHGRILTLAQG